MFAVGITVRSNERSFAAKPDTPDLFHQAVPHDLLRARQREGHPRVWVYAELDGIARQTGPGHDDAGPWPLSDVYDELSVNLAGFNQLVGRHHILKCEGPIVETRHQLTTFCKARCFPHDVPVMLTTFASE